jgi:hypothetical protein
MAKNIAIKNRIAALRAQIDRIEDSVNKGKYSLAYNETERITVYDDALSKAIFQQWRKERPK